MVTTATLPTMATELEEQEEEDEEEEKAMASLCMRLEAMTWASQAKDVAIADLQAKLYEALSIVEKQSSLLKESQEKKLTMEIEVRRREKVEDMIERQLKHTLGKLRKAEEAEERMAAQIGELEADSAIYIRQQATRIRHLEACLALAEEECPSPINAEFPQLPLMAISKLEEEKKLSNGEDELSKKKNRKKKKRERMVENGVVDDSLIAYFKSLLMGKGGLHIKEECSNSKVEKIGFKLGFLPLLSH